MKIDAVSSSEMSVKYHNTRRHIPEDKTLHVGTTTTSSSSFLSFLPVSLLQDRVCVSSPCNTSGCNSQYSKMSHEGSILSANLHAFSRSPHEVRADCEVLQPQCELTPIKQLRAPRPAGALASGPRPPNG